MLQSLLSAGRKLHSLKIARVASALAAFNPFEKVLAMIRETITVIEEEEKTDVEKKDWCAPASRKGADHVDIFSHDSVFNTVNREAKRGVGGETDSYSSEG